MKAPDAASGKRFAILALALFMGACAYGRRGPTGPVVSPTGIVYELGTPPEDTRFSQTATLYLRQDRSERALEFALEGIEADPQNPIHYFLAGSAYVRMEDYARANTMFTEAQRIYPAYELDVEPERESGWAVAFNAGIEAYGEGDLDAAIDAWRDAILIFDLRPEAHRNLAGLLAGEGRYGAAIDVYRDALEGLEKVPATRVLEEEEVGQRAEAREQIETSLVQLLLFEGQWAEAEPFLRRRMERDPTNVRVRSDLARVLDGQGRSEEASEIYASLLSEERLESTQLFNLGVALFRSSNFDEAGRAFRRLTEIQPESRDAWFNYANALFAAEAWQELSAIGERIVELDPLGENAALIAARAHLEAGDEDAALLGLQESDAAPLHVAQLQMRPSGAGTSVHGQAVGNEAEPGTPVSLRFIFYGDSGRLGAETVTVPAPPAGEEADFEVAFTERAGWYRYEVVNEGAEGS